MRLVDLSGRRFGRLFVEFRGPSENKRTRWNCLCDCGNRTLVRSQHLLSGRISSCGCGQREAAAKVGHARANPDSIKNTLYCRYRIAARNRGINFLLTKHEFFELISRPCCYCGGEPSNFAKHPVYPLYYNGIDRWDNSLGYTKDNSVSCCKPCNFMKVTLSGSEFIEQCKKVANFRSSWD